MKHPYEAFGIVAAGVCLVFVMAIPIGDFVLQEAGDGSSAGSSSTPLEKYTPMLPKQIWDNYYKNNNDMQLDCKKTSNDLQEFYDCVNKP